MEFFHSHQLGDVNSYDDIIAKIKSFNKFDKLIIVNDDDTFTSVIVDLDNNHKKLTKKDMTFHLPGYKKVNDSMCGKICAICQESYKNNEYYRELNKCGHCFHKKCVDQWFFKSKSYSCPNCRKNPFSFL